MFRKLRFIWRLFTTFVSRRRKLILLSFLVGVIAFFIAPKLFSYLAARQKTITIGLVGRHTTTNIPNSVQNQISLGLTQLKEDGTAKIGLAQEWMVEDGGKTYTFKLANNRYWHDGTKITAKDINYKFKDVETNVLDEKTIQFKLKEPFSPFPAIVSRPIFKSGLIGAGSYKVAKISKNGQFIENILLLSLDPKKSNIRYRFYPTESAAKTAFKLGEVDRINDLLDSSGFEEWKNIDIQTHVKLDRYLAVFFNTAKAPLDSKSFRQALAYAVPKDPSQARALGPVSPLSWAYNDDLKPYLQDVDNAKKLLGKIEGDKPIIKLRTSSTLLAEADNIAKSWSLLGITTDIQPLNSDVGDFDALLAIQEIPDDPDQYSLWHSSQEDSNITNFNNPRIDQLLEEGRKTQDVAKRKQIYFDFQRFLVEEVPAIFLYHPLTYDISKK